VKLRNERIKIMDVINIITGIISSFVSVVTLILVGVGLRIWKIQLKGENTFKLSLDVLRELKLTLIFIDDYRHPFYSANEIDNAFRKYNSGRIPDFMNTEERKLAQKCAELERWNKIIVQFNIYTDRILRLAISINNYDIDLVNDKRLRDYLIEMGWNRSRKEFADEEREQLKFMEKEERDKLKEEILDINKVLLKNKNDDNWGKTLEQYFEEINKRLRVYIK